MPRKKKTTLAMTDPVSQVLSDADVDQTVVEINALRNQAGLQLALDIGKLVIKRFYDGDARLVGSKDPNQHMSYRKLAEHPDLDISASHLYRCVAVTELCERLGVARGNTLV